MIWFIYDILNNTIILYYMLFFINTTNSNEARKKELVVNYNILFLSIRYHVDF